jgi:hypothetical protein
MFLDEVSEHSWYETEVLRNVNYAYHKFVTAAMTTFEDYYLDTVVFSLVNARQEYDVATDGLPSDLFKIRRVELNYDIVNNPTYFRKAMPINITEVKDDLANTGRGSKSYPLYYSYGFGSDFKLGFLPIPEADAVNGGKLWYIYEVPNLVTATDIVKIPYAERYSDGIALIAAGTLLRKGQQEEAPARNYILEGEAMKDQMMQELEDRIADEGKVIMDSIGANLDFTDPY